MSLFRGWFGKKESFPAADLSVLQTDIHSHFIPGIDDGAATIEDSLNMLKRMSDLGYSKVITTPHIMSDFYRNTPEIILNGLEKVRAAVREAGINIEVDAAAEYYLDFDFERKIKEEKLLTFGNNYVLFEISYMNPPDNINGVIFQLLTSGYKPVLAHPERYPYWLKQFHKYEEIIEKGALLQLNVNSLTGHYSLDTKKIAEMLIDKNMISFIGTDCHHIGHLDLLHRARNEKYLHKLLSSGRLLNSSL